MALSGHEQLIYRRASQQVETKQEGYLYHAGVIYKSKNVPFISVSVEKQLHCRQGLKCYIKEFLFSLQSDKEWKLKVTVRM